MITIRPRILDELRSKEAGSEGRIKYELDVKGKEERNTVGTPQAQERQVLLIGRIKVSLERFRQMACELDIEVASRDGRSIMEGRVCTYDQMSQEATLRILDDTGKKVRAFSRAHPKASFTLTYTHSATILDADYDEPEVPSGMSPN